MAAVDEKQAIELMALGTKEIWMISKGRLAQYYVFFDEEKNLVCWTHPNVDQLAGSIDVRLIKEIRVAGENDPLPEVKKAASSLQGEGISLSCGFSIYFGDKFTLNHVCCVARNTRVYKIWISGLQYLMKPDSQLETLVIRRYLKKEFSLMDSTKKKVDKKCILAFLKKVHLKKKSNDMTALFQKFDTYGRGYLLFNQFVNMYEFMMSSPKASALFLGCCMEKTHMSLVTFQQFLLKEQKDTRASEVDYVRDILKVHGVSDNIGDLVFTSESFQKYILSKHNDIAREESYELTDDMSQPLSHYFIKSSHNTYLTGDQFASMSSIECYIRSLRMGCRCIELDCWDGSDGEPVIYHGRTLTSKLKFKEVVKAISIHAWDSSPYPVIISVENHCCLQQQDLMADYMKQYFGTSLLTYCNSEDDHMLSPEELKYKFIIKGKKIKDHSTSQGAFSSSASSLRSVKAIASQVWNESFQNSEVAHSIRNGYLFLLDPVDNEWVKEFVVLLKNELHYGDAPDIVDEYDYNYDFYADADIYGEVEEEVDPWFHGKIDRATAVRLLQTGSHIPNGAFLIREKNPGQYALSFRRNGQVYHALINFSNGKYSLVDDSLFDSLSELVDFYQNNLLASTGFNIKLTEPIPPPSAPIKEKWFHGNISKQKAEQVLLSKKSGTFLVRQSETDTNTYSISLNVEGSVKHCRVMLEGRVCIVGNSEFDSIGDLIKYYKKHSLYRKVKLKYPILARDIEQFEVDSKRMEMEASDIYVEAAELTKVMCRALCDFRGSQQNELSFSKSAIITDVEKKEGQWWKGKCNGIVGYFPNEYVEVISIKKGDVDRLDDNPLGNLQKGGLSIRNCTVTPVGEQYFGMNYAFRVVTYTNEEYVFAALSAEEMEDWKQSLQLTSHQNDVLLSHLSKKQKISANFSDLIIYCATYPIDTFNSPEDSGHHWEMCSQSENRAIDLINKSPDGCVRFTKRKFCRVYPSGRRLDSSNYDPIFFWNAGVQMAALNYQTADKPMWTEHALFRRNNSCGYVLKPPCLRLLRGFNPNEPSTFQGSPKRIELHIFSGRHLSKSVKGYCSPVVELEILGLAVDKNQKYRTKCVVNNGFNPHWRDEVCHFLVRMPDLAFLRISVLDEGVFGDPYVLGQRVIPINDLRQGYRSVVLNNSYSEELELSALFVKCKVSTVVNSGQGDIYAAYSKEQQLRDLLEDLAKKIEVDFRLLDGAMKIKASPGSSKQIRDEAAYMCRDLDAKIADNQKQQEIIQQEILNLSNNERPSVSAQGSQRFNLRRLNTNPILRTTESFGSLDLKDKRSSSLKK
eukprot:Nk52_evm4s2496 gene=Nk52_evmTU4s2496